MNLLRGWGELFKDFDKKESKPKIEELLGDGKWFSPQDVGILFGVTSGTVLGWVREKLIPITSIYMRRGTFISRMDLVSFIIENDYEEYVLNWRTSFKIKEVADILNRNTRWVHEKIRCKALPTLTSPVKILYISYKSCKDFIKFYMLLQDTSYYVNALNTLYQCKYDNQSKCILGAVRSKTVEKQIDLKSDEYTIPLLAEKYVLRKHIVSDWVIKGKLSAKLLDIEGTKLGLIQKVYYVICQSDFDKFRRQYEDLFQKEKKARINLGCNSILNIRDVYEILNISEKKVYDDMKSGILKTILYGGSRKVLRKDLIEYARLNPIQLKDIDQIAFAKNNIDIIPKQQVVNLVKELKKTSNIVESYKEIQVKKQEKVKGKSKMDLDRLSLESEKRVYEGKLDLIVKTFFSKKDVFTTYDLIDIWGISRGTVEGWIHTGWFQISTLKSEKQCLRGCKIPKNDILNFIEENGLEDYTLENQKSFSLKELEIILGISLSWVRRQIQYGAVESLNSPTCYVRIPYTGVLGMLNKFSENFVLLENEKIEKLKAEYRKKLNTFNLKYSVVIPIYAVEEDVEPGKVPTLSDFKEELEPDTYSILEVIKSWGVCVTDVLFWIKAEQLSVGCNWNTVQDVQITLEDLRQFKNDHMDRIISSQKRYVDIRISEDITFDILSAANFLNLYPYQVRKCCGDGLIESQSRGNGRIDINVTALKLQSFQTLEEYKKLQPKFVFEIVQLIDQPLVTSLAGTEEVESEPDDKDNIPLRSFVSCNQFLRGIIIETLNNIDCTAGDVNYQEKLNNYFIQLRILTKKFTDLVKKS